MPGKGAFDVLEPPPAVVANLGRGGPDSDQLARRLVDGEPRPQLGRKQLSLVEPALAEPGRMERHRDCPTGRQSLDHEPLGQQQAQGLGQPPPALILEPLHGQLDRTFVGDCGTEASESTQTAGASTLPAHGLNLGPAPAAHRLLEPPNPPAAAVAEPRADHAAAPASRRQQKIRQAREHNWRLRVESSLS